tara:strand:+ start:352 stop:915 length:564 start_codon:yes stop_codon:yes gene_type:complete
MVYYLDTMSSFTSSRLIVGTPEWLASKNYTHPKMFSNYECDSASIPKKKVTHPAHYAGLKNLQSKMMDNGWRLCEGEGDEKDFFVHPTYPDSKFPALTVNVGNTTFILPLVSMDNDRKGLGCSFSVKPGMNYSVLRCNEWTSYWTTRTGKRRAKYHNYLDEREQKRLAFEEEAVEALKLKQNINSNL